MINVTEATGLQLLCKEYALLTEAVYEGHHESYAVFLNGSFHVLSLLNAYRHGLLAKYVLSCVCGSDGKAFMRYVAGTNADSVYIRVTEDIIIAAVGLLNTISVTECLRAFYVPVKDGRYLRPLTFEKRRYLIISCDRTGANYCNSQLLVRHVRLHQSTSLMATGLSSAMDLRAAKLTAKLLRLSETLGTHPALPSSWPFMSCSTPALSLPGK